MPVKHTYKITYLDKNGNKFYAFPVAYNFTFALHNFLRLNQVDEANIKSIVKGKAVKQ